MNNKSNGMQKAGTLYFVGSLFNKGIAFLTVPIFTRLLSPSDYGIVTTYNSWVAILGMVMGFALHTSVRIAFIDYRDKMNHYMATVTTFTLLCGSAISAVVLLGAWYFGTYSQALLVVLCLCQSLTSALVEDYSMYLMMQYRYKFRTALMVLPNLLSVIVSVILLKYVFHDTLYLGRIIPSALFTSLFGILVCFLVFRDSKCFLNREYLRNALHFSIPLILHGVALNILSQSDRTMITLLADSAQTGIYSLIYNFGMIATVITTSLEGIWVPWFYQELQEQHFNEVNTVAKDYVNLIAYCLIGVIMIGPEVVKLLASSNYWEGIKIIPAVVISNFVIFAYTLFVNVEHYHKETRNITVNTVTAAVTNLALNALLIPWYGYVAAAYTTLVSYAVSLLLHAFYSKKYEPKLFSLGAFTLPLAELTGATVLFYTFLDNAIVRWSAVLVFEVLMVFKERTKISVYLSGKTK